MSADLEIRRPVFYRVGTCPRCGRSVYPVSIGKSSGDTHDSYCGCGGAYSWEDSYRPMHGQEKIVEEMGYWHDGTGWRRKEDKPDPLASALAQRDEAVALLKSVAGDPYVNGTIGAPCAFYPRLRALLASLDQPQNDKA